MNLYMKQQTMYANCDATGQHTFCKEVKSRLIYKLCNAAADCKNKQINLGLSASSSASYFTLYCAINKCYIFKEFYEEI